MIEIVADIDFLKVQESISDVGSGGSCFFLGTVRNQTKGKEVKYLEFEAYKPMALKELEKLCDAAKQRWGLKKVAIQHIVGKKELGQAVVAIGVASAHREDAFTACKFLIDELKKTVPIWKKEYFEDRSVWVSAHP